MKLTSRQIRECIENAKKCPHLVVFYNCDDVGYPCGWVETWTCLVCGIYDYHSTGGNGQCLGEFGNRKFSKVRVIIVVDDWFCKHYSEHPYRTFDCFFKELRKKEEKCIYIRERNRIKRFVINQQISDSELENVINKISKFLE